MPEKKAETKPESNPYKKPWRVVLMPDRSFVQGFNNEALATASAEERTTRGRDYASKPAYAAIQTPQDEK